MQGGGRKSISDLIENIGFNLEPSCYFLTTRYDLELFGRWVGSITMVSSLSLLEMLTA
jgi:hypothetical protein